MRKNIRQTHSDNWQQRHPSRNPLRLPILYEQTHFHYWKKQNSRNKTNGIRYSFRFTGKMCPLQRTAIATRRKSVNTRWMSNLPQSTAMQQTPKITNFSFPYSTYAFAFFSPSWLPFSSRKSWCSWMERIFFCITKLLASRRLMLITAYSLGS